MGNTDGYMFHEHFPGYIFVVIEQFADTSLFCFQVKEIYFYISCVKLYLLLYSKHIN